MGKHGFPPQPTRLKMLRGNPGRRPLNDAEPQPRPGRPKRPAWLTREAARTWNEVVAELEPLGLVTQADRWKLAWFCIAHAIGIAAVDALLTNGLVYETEKGHVQQRPEMAILSEMIRQVRGLGAEFGLSPSDRSRLRVEKPAEANALDAFLSRNRGAN